MFGDSIISNKSSPETHLELHQTSKSDTQTILNPPLIEKKCHSTSYHETPMSSNDSDSWGAVASSYVQVERLTTPPCQTLVNRVSLLLPLNVPNTIAFDNGCGTGVLSAVLRQQYPRLPLLATDASHGMVNILRRRIEHRKWDEVRTRVVDSRNLEGIQDGSFTHVFSTFMVCLAPEPDKIVGEMQRVMKPGGVLGLAVWGDPQFGPFSTPWEKACRRLVPDYEAPMVMDAKSTFPASVEAGLLEPGFKDVVVWEEDVPWRWDDVEAVSKYYLEGNNPGNVGMIDAFKARGGDVEEVRPIFEGIIKEDSGQKDGSIELHAPATLATARK